MEEENNEPNVQDEDAIVKPVRPARMITRKRRKSNSV